MLLARGSQPRPPSSAVLRLPRCLCLSSTPLTSPLTYLGASGLKEYEYRTNARKGKNVDDTDTINENVRIYFPSLETVNRSKRGKDVSTVLFIP